MKFSELKQEDYALDTQGAPEQKGGGGLERMATQNPLTRAGVGIGTEIGKGVLGIPQLALKVAEKITGATGMEGPSQVLSEAGKGIETAKKKLFEEPFKEQLESGLGKVGQAVGIGATFLAPNQQIIGAQKVATALLKSKTGLQGVSTLIGRAVPETIGAGATEFVRTGGDAESAKEVGLITGGASGALTLLGGAARASFWPELNQSAARALGIQGKTTGGRVLPGLDKKVTGLGVLKKYAPETTVKDAHNFEVKFDPNKASFHEVLQAWNKTKQTIFDKYSAISKAAGQNTDVDISEVSSTLADVLNGARTSSYKNAARSILQDLTANFGQYDDAGQLIGFRKVNPKELETYLSDLYGEAAATLAGRADKAHGEIAAATAKRLKDMLDDMVDKASGPEYSALRGEYSALKSIEEDLVRRFQQEARQLGGGLTDYVNVFSSGDIIGGILFNQPAQVAKGLTQGMLGTFMRGLKRPDRYLQRSFKLIDRKSVDPTIERLFGSSRAMTEREQKVFEAAQEYLKTPKMGLSIEDVSKLHPEDKNALIQYIDAIRTKKDVPEQVLSDAERIISKLGFDMNKPTQRLADFAEAVVSGKKDVSALYKSGGEREVLERSVKVKDLERPKVGSASSDLTEEARILHGTKGMEVANIKTSGRMFGKAKIGTILGVAAATSGGSIAGALAVSKIYGIPTDWTKNLTDEVKDSFPFEEESLKELEDVSIKQLDLPDGVKGQYGVRGKEIYNLAKAIGLSDEIAIKVAEWKLSQKIDKPTIHVEKDLREPIQKILAHEMLHHLSLTKDKKESGKFLEDWFYVWNDNIEKYPQLAEIDERLKRSGYDFDNPRSISGERYSFLGQEAIEYGINAIPPELREFYKGVIKMPDHNQ